MKFGMIGMGNMANAIVGGILKNQIMKAADMIGADHSEEAAKQMGERYGIRVALNNAQVVRESDVILLAVKPIFMQDVIGEIRPYINEEKLIISIAAGKTIEWMEECFDRNVKLIRCMPNTPALVLEGCTGICCNAEVSEADRQFCLSLMESFGKAFFIPERMMDAVVAVSGSSPAYVFILIEAMADAAVAEGMPRAQAYEMAAQAVLGSARMVLETGKHPAELKDMVCSPGGTTIQAVKVLEEKGFRSAVMEAMGACAEMSRKL